MASAHIRNKRASSCEAPPPLPGANALYSDKMRGMAILEWKKAEVTPQRKPTSTWGVEGGVTGWGQGWGQGWGKGRG